MGKKEKLLKRLTESPTPRDFKWTDLTTLLSKCGFQERSGAGSRCKFIHPSTKTVIIVHKPHPNTTLRVYNIKQIITKLQEIGIIK